MSINLDDYQVEGEPTIYYIPEYITKDEETLLMNWTQNVPKPRWTQLQNRRLQNWGGYPTSKGMISEDLPPLLKRYTEKIGSLGLFGDKSPNHVLINEYLPSQGIMPHLDGPIFFPTITTINLGSSTILNLYRPLDVDVEDSSLSNTNSEKADDDEAKMNAEGKNSCKSTLSWSDRLQFSLFLEPRSLLILKDKMYTHYLHGIEEKQEDVISNLVLNVKNCTSTSDLTYGQVIPRQTRISFTIRFVEKSTTKSFLRLGRK